MNPADLLPSAARRQTASLDVIEREVVAAFGLSDGDLHRPTHEVRWAWPRQVAMWLMAELTGLPHTLIAERFAKERTTVLYACRMVRARMDSYPKLKRELTALQRKIENETRTAGETEMARWAANVPEITPACLPDF